MTKPLPAGCSPCGVGNCAESEPSAARIYFDAGHTVTVNYVTGIQRVVRNVVEHAGAVGREMNVACRPFRQVGRHLHECRAMFDDRSLLTSIVRFPTLLENGWHPSSSASITKNRLGPKTSTGCARRSIRAACAARCGESRIASASRGFAAGAATSDYDPGRSRLAA